MKQIKILFVCSHNKIRSKTAETIYKNDPRLKVASAGISNSATKKINHQDLRWADVILCMEKNHQEKIKKLFPTTDLPTIINLDIKDRYQYMDQDLIDKLQNKVEPIIQRFTDQITGI